MDSQEFLKTLKKSKEGLKYLNLVEENKGKRDLKWKKGFERHHIQPKALGGSDDRSNLVKLTVFDHILAHIYLAKALPCYDTVAATCIMCGRRVKTLSEVEKITLEEAYDQAQIRQLRRKYRRPKTDEENRHFVEQSKKTRIEKYGSLMSQAHTEQAVKQRLKTIAERYNGDSAGQMHTDKSRLARKLKMISEYGGCTKHMQNPEIIEKARQTRIKHAQQSREIIGTQKFQEWFKNHPEYTSEYFSVPKFLKELGQSREEFLENK